MEELELFLNSIKSSETKKKYNTYFNKYLELTGLTDPFCHNDPKLIEKELINFIVVMKEKNMSYSAIQNYTAAALAFYKINDVVLNTTKIGKFMPEQRRVRKDRAYTHQEISKLLEFTDERINQELVKLPTLKT